MIIMHKIGDRKSSKTQKMGQTAADVLHFGGSCVLYNREESKTRCTVTKEGVEKRGGGAVKLICKVVFCLALAAVIYLLGTMLTGISAVGFLAAVYVWVKAWGWYDRVYRD